MGLLEEERGLGPAEFLTGRQWGAWSARLLVAEMAAEELWLLRVARTARGRRDARDGNAGGQPVPPYRYRALHLGPDGALYAAVEEGFDEERGFIWKFVANGTAPAAGAGRGGAAGRRRRDTGGARGARRGGAAAGGGRRGTGRRCGGRRAGRGGAAAPPGDRRRRRLQTGQSRAAPSRLGRRRARGSVGGLDRGHRCNRCVVGPLRVRHWACTGRGMQRGPQPGFGARRLVGAFSRPGTALTGPQLTPLEFRHIGPVGNRISAVYGVPDNPRIYYAGAASGGLWKSEDGGLHWQPCSTNRTPTGSGSSTSPLRTPTFSMGGDRGATLRSNVTIGDGVYRSLDGGDRWEHRGLSATGRISKVRVHPSNPDLVYIASLGHTHAPQRERGIYRNRDGGETWEHVLFVDERAPVPAIWSWTPTIRASCSRACGISSSTPGAAGGGRCVRWDLYKPRRGGHLAQAGRGHGLPRLPVGKIGLCMSPADSYRIYALIETGDGVPWKGQDTESGELWRSDDGGTSWLLMTHNRDFGGRTGYYNNCRVLPDDPDEAFFLTAALTRTIDGGVTGITQTGLARPGGDYHDLWIDPTNADRMIVGNDGGLAVSHNRGRTWMRTQLPVAQMYHVTVDNAVPYNVLGNRQDGPSFRGPSNSLYGRRFIPRGDWHAVGGGRERFRDPDPEDPEIVWSSASGSGARGGIVVRIRRAQPTVRDVEVWPESTGGWPAEISGSGFSGPFRSSSALTTATPST